MIPLCFEYVPSKQPKQRIYVTILQQFKHHYTGVTMYRVREESDAGWVAEYIYGEDYVRHMLANKVEDTK